MRRLLNSSWARALGSAALLAVAAVVFVVLILPAAAFGSKRAKKYTCAEPPANFSFSPTKGRPGTAVVLTGKNLDDSDVYFRDAQGGTIKATNDPIDNRMIRTFVPDGASSGKIAVQLTDPGDSSVGCGLFRYSSKSFNVK